MNSKILLASFLAVSSMAVASRSFAQEATRAHANSALMAQDIAEDAKAKGASSLVVINLIGQSDAEYANKGQIVENFKAKLRSLAKRGTYIVVVAGNTDSGVGRLVTAAQDPAFISEIEKMGAKINTAGVSSAEAKEYMNKQLKFTTLVPTQNGSWESKVAPGDLSQVSSFSLEAAISGRQTGIPQVKVETVIMEGGVIGMQDMVELLVESSSVAKDAVFTDTNGRTHNVSSDVLNSLKYTIEVGHKAGTEMVEMATNKGPTASTNLALTLAEVGARILPEGFSFDFVQVDGAGQIVSVTENATVKDLKKFAAEFVNSPKGKPLVDAAIEYTKLQNQLVELQDQLNRAISSGESEGRKGEIATRIASLEYAIDQKFGSMPQGDLKTKAKVYKKLSDKTIPEAKDMQAMLDRELARHMKNRAIIAFASRASGFLNALELKVARSNGRGELTRSAREVIASLKSGGMVGARTAATVSAEVKASANSIIEEARLAIGRGAKK